MITVALLSLSSSMAVQIGKVTLTKPATKPVQNRQIVKPVTRVVSPAALPHSTASQQSERHVNSTVPDGWYEVRGRISAAGGNTALPTGSSVKVSVVNTVSSAQVVSISFKVKSLSTPYQIYFNPTRINKSGKYAVQASVLDASGKTSYSSAQLIALSGMRSVADITVH